jgi:hypothetical protein
MQSPNIQYSGSTLVKHPANRNQQMPSSCVCLNLFVSGV